MAKVFSIEIPPGEIDYSQLESQIILFRQTKEQQKIIEKQQQQLEEHLKTAEEMDRLRKEAVRLKLDRTDVIMEKYTLKELKQAIKKWRAENERPLT